MFQFFRGRLDSRSLATPPLWLTAEGWLLFLRRDSLQAVEVRPQGLRDDDRAIGLLVVFENRQPSPANGQAAAIEGVQIFRLPALASPEPQVGAASLKGFKV